MFIDLLEEAGAGVALAFRVSSGGGVGNPLLVQVGESRFQKAVGDICVVLAEKNVKLEAHGDDFTFKGVKVRAWARTTREMRRRRCDGMGAHVVRVQPEVQGSTG